MMRRGHKDIGTWIFALSLVMVGTRDAGKSANQLRRCSRPGFRFTGIRVAECFGFFDE